MDAEDIDLLLKALQAQPGAEVSVDLAARQVRCGELVAPFQLDDYTRWRLMEGLDDIALTMRQAEAIAAYESAREPWRPTTLPAKHLPPAPVVSAR
jgi:3-isopropylmalate/(R)-2-methylmalate dehydratase small subunit